MMASRTVQCALGALLLAGVTSCGDNIPALTFGTCTTVYLSLVPTHPAYLCSMPDSEWPIGYHVPVQLTGRYFTEGSDVVAGPLWYSEIEYRTGVVAESADGSDCTFVACDALFGSTSRPRPAW